MGWFDDDDDDDEEGDRRSKLAAPLSLADIQADNKDGNNDEEDPLDAYMQGIHSKAKHDQETAGQNTTPATSERLDVENEEEATSHWKESSTAVTEESSSTTTTTATAAATESATEAKAAMDATFHKAASADNRQVDIQLNKVKHSSVEYADFQKAILQPTTTLSLTSNNSSSNNNYNNSTAADSWRRDNKISCHPPMDPIYDFAELRDVFPNAVMEWIRKNGYQNPTLVQSQTLGVALRGKDAIITSHTGSGKTLAYLWPLIAHLEENDGKCRALVLVPTRELALQVEKVAKSIFAKLPFVALAITGGNMGRYQLSQTLIKNKPHLVVATPGRLLDVLSAQQKNKQNWLLQEISFLVLDEADKMLQLGFAPQVSQVLDSLRPDRQSLLTSATLNKKLERLCREKWMDDPIRISIGRTGQSSAHVEQHVMCLPNAQAKEGFLKEMLPVFCDVGRTLVFCATREGCEALGQKLQAILPTVTLHGDKHASDRKAALKAFVKGHVKLLVATDVAGRGLDVPQVSTVVNYEPAKNWDTHVHRIGRAGRLSTKEQQSGSAYTLLLPSNADFAHTLVQAFTRENRPIGNDLLSLASQARRRGGTGGGASNGGGSHRKIKDKTGLGFYGPDPVGDSGVPPAQKRSRWS